MNINLQYISLYLIFSIFYNLTSPNSLSLKVFTVLQLCNILLLNFSKSMKEIVCKRWNRYKEKGKRRLGRELWSGMLLFCVINRLHLLCIYKVINISNIY